MELKYDDLFFAVCSQLVLIVPLWNWNRHKNKLVYKRNTFKSYLYGIEIGKACELGKLGKCSNRTFMELKCHNYSDLISDWEVLIVPLWNWNSLIVWKPYSGVCSNRTFMELKLNTGRNLNAQLYCSNRTFMELKLKLARILSKRKRVLIVPLWNWNSWTKKIYVSGCSSSNRTFMELK